MKKIIIITFFCYFFTQKCVESPLIKQRNILKNIIKVLPELQIINLKTGKFEQKGHDLFKIITCALFSIRWNNVVTSLETPIFLEDSKFNNIKKFINLINYSHNFDLKIINTSNGKLTNSGIELMSDIRLNIITLVHELTQLNKINVQKRDETVKILEIPEYNKIVFTKKTGAFAKDGLEIVENILKSLVLIYDN